VAGSGAPAGGPASYMTSFGRRLPEWWPWLSWPTARSSTWCSVVRRALDAAYGLVAMGAVFAGATRAPLTASASVLEMSGDFGMVLPVMLGTALASAVSARLTYGTIYTTKLLRRGIDIERPKTGAILRLLTVADAMVPLPGRVGSDSFAHRAAAVAVRGKADAGEGELRGRPPGTGDPEETIEDALGHLARYGHEGLPVVGGWPCGGRVGHKSGRVACARASPRPSGCGG
jgi:Voltage gated chloride channel